MSQDVFSYPGEKVDVTWDRRLCIHVSECTRAANDVFESGRKPWGEPDTASPVEVAETVERCPSGALAYVRKDGGPAESPDVENTIVVSLDGPLLVRGELALEGAADDMPGTRTRAALCRCGASGNKPFCDNSHRGAAFRDGGAVGDAGEALTDAGGRLGIVPSENGPYLLEGKVTLVTASGRRAWQGTETALCRCGHSESKPFCDGSHARVGFVG